jgi:hypothetical protein
VPDCIPPAVYAVVSGPTTQPPPSTIYFSCLNLAGIPALANVQCGTAPYPGAATPLGTLTIPATASIGQTVYIGLVPSTGVLHVSAPFSVGCDNCYQELFPAPGIGEYQIANYVVGIAMQSTWTGYPALPTVTVTGCDTNGYTISYGPGSITVVCN